MSNPAWISVSNRCALQRGEEGGGVESLRKFKKVLGSSRNLNFIFEFLNNFKSNF